MHEFAVETLFATVYDFIEETVLPPFRWDRFSNILKEYRSKRATSLHAYVDVLPILTCAAAGGRPDKAIPLAASWTFYILAARIFDDQQDDEGAEHTWNDGGVKEALPIGLHAMGAAQAALSHLEGGGGTHAAILGAFGNSLALSAKAQSEQPTLDDLSVEWYFRLLAAKTGLIFATGAWAGARVSLDTPDPATVDALYQYGLNTGMAAQIADDCYDLAEADLANNTLSLPVIYALSQKQHDKHPLLISLLQEPSAKPERIARIVEVLEEIEAIAWSLKVARVYQGQALAALEQFPEDKIQPLVYYVSRDLRVAL